MPDPYTQISLLTVLPMLLAVGAVVWWLMRRSSGEAVEAIDRMAHDELFLNSPCSVVLTDTQDVILDVNQAYERLTGRRRDEVTGMPLRFNHSGQMDEDAYLRMRQALVEHGRWEGEFWLRNAGGEAFSEKVTRVVVRGTDGRPVGYLTISMDMVGSEDEQRMMLWQAHHDTLTKLPNRNLFLERFGRVLMGDHQGALISVDLDNFKIVNDSIGPAKGDQLLMQAAFRIALCARESDTVARIAGDHFVILLDSYDNYAELEQIAREIVEQVALPFQVDERELFVTASVGVSAFPQDGEEPGELMQKADAARLQVKKNGGNNVAFFESAMNARAERRLEIESELRRAIREEELLLHYQPVVRPNDRTIVGAEALVRWQHPEQGLISPGEFIPIAEESGLINDLGAWVIRQVRRDLKSSPREVSGLRISVNVSAAQMKSRKAINELIAVLAEDGCDGLTVELTESALIGDREGVQAFIEQVRLLGCRTALDDFGTGFSSLSYLRDFEFDVLKIDKTFIDRLHNTLDYGLVSSIVSMGRILGMQVIAEGVEDQEQVERLQRIACDYIQGFFYSRPLPFGEFLDYLSRERLQQTG